MVLGRSSGFGFGFVAWCWYWCWCWTGEEGCGCRLETGLVVVCGVITVHYTVLIPLVSCACFSLFYLCVEGTGIGCLRLAAFSWCQGFLCCYLHHLTKQGGRDILASGNG